MSPLELLTLPALLLWGAVALDRTRAWPGELTLPAGAAASPPRGTAAAAPAVTAIVPARDEAALLPSTLPALLTQELPGLRVVLVDDGSSDGTGRLAAELAAAAEGAPLTVVRAGPAPEGWKGKVWAQHRGLERTATDGAPEWLLLVDADVRLRPSAAGALLAQAGRERCDLVSVMARLHCRGFWERLLIPPFVFFFQLLYPFRRVADPGSPVAACAGGCVLVRYRSLAAAGGFDAIRGAVIDDLALARAVAAAGGRLWLGLDDGIASLRAYPGLGGIWEMVARSAFAELGYRYSLLAGAVVALLAAVAAPPFVLAAALLRDGPLPATAAVVLGAAGAWALEARALLPVVRHHRAPTAWCLGLPFAAAVYAAICCASGWRHLRGTGVRWKGRSYAR